ncbi:MAG TPA: hypothetical protein PLP23_03190 [Panacibacter sp.]|nr:hypothetical protein [Panacibacter sp.]
MNNYQLNWDGFDWGQFQRLCILIAEYKFPECDFQEYLKQGHKQDGTDLHSFDYKNGTLLNVQCKRLKKLSETDLKEIIREFTNNDLVKKTSYFILATSVDTNTPSLTKAIVKNKEDLLNNQKIQFHCWGKLEIEKYLKENWGIVYTYFGKEAADAFCYPQLKESSFKNLHPIPDYIPRKIFRSNIKNDQIFGWYFDTKQLENLIELIANDRVISKRICIIGDAYQGKSSYLKHTAFSLKSHSLRLHPLLIEIKDVNIVSIEEILERNFGQWKSIPLKDIVIFIDGLDEAPTDKFREMVKHINQFAKSTPSANIVLSCRKQFYNQLGVKEELEQFQLFELYRIQEDERNDYLKRTLKGSIPAFLSLVRKADVIGFLEHPFYLVNLIEEYNQSQQIPNSKIGVIELFIKKAYENSLIRRIRNGQIIEDELPKFKQVISHFALALQFAGVNAFKYEEVLEIFNSNERELLRHNSVVHISDGSWSFVNAMFQEYFAALVLSNLPFNQIVGYVTIGTKFKKIKEKWVQTISSLLSILPSKSTLFNQVLDLIEQDNIELLFQADTSKFDAKFKDNLLKKLIEKCIQTNTRTGIVYENTIGDFIDGVKPAITYLITCLKRKDITEHIKEVCVRILRSMHLPNSFDKEILEIVVHEIENSSNPYFAGQLIQLLTARKLGDEHLLDKLITYFPNKHEYRDDVYELITTLNLQEHYYDYALQGIPFLLLHNKGISHHGSSTSLEELFLSTNSRANFWKLFKKMQDTEWLEFYQHRTATTKDFITRLFDKCIEFHKTDPLIILPVTSYIEAIGKQYLRSEFGDIDRFLDETNTHKIVVRLLINKIFEDNNWEIGAIITADSYDYILFEFEEANRSMKGLKNCLSGLRYKRKDEIHNQFQQLCDDATEEMISDKTHWADQEEYLKLEKQRKENDKKYILSVESFREGVVKYFDAYGKKTIPDDDLYVDTSDRLERKQFDSQFVFRFLINWRRNKTNVHLKNCLKWLENEDNFEFFRADEIVDYSFDSEEDKSFYLTILKEYYYKKLIDANFENCKWSDGNAYHWRTVESKLGEIFEKFQLETPEKYLIEMIWLDAGGIRGFEVSKANNKKSISGLVIDRLSTAGVETLKEKILSNIKKGIKLQSVLGTHLALCRYLKIKEATDEILKIIQNKKYTELYLGDVVDIFLELGGSMDEIVDMVSKLKNYNEHWYLHLIKLITPSNRDEAMKSLKEAILELETEEDVKIEVAKHLADLGDLQGFKFLTEPIRANQRSPYTIQGRLSIHNVDTALGLTELEDLMYLIVDKKYDNEQHFHDTAKNILIELLYGFAGKSEVDLEKVIEFCEKTESSLKEKRYDNATHFNFYINRMIENFRSSDKTVKSISDIKTIMQSLSQ